MSGLFEVAGSFQTIVVASVLASVLVYFKALKEYFFGGRLQDAAGNGIPPGPVGLPIVGTC